MRVIVLKKIKYIPQFMQTECGLCCIVMIANFHNHYITLSDLRDYQQPGRDGVSAKHLCKILDWIQFDYKVYKCGVPAIPQLRLPAIAFCENSHFVVVEQVTSKKITVVDPAMGRVIFAHNEFEAVFSGILICPYPKRDIKLKTKPPNEWHQFLSLISSNKAVLLGGLGFSLLAYVTSLAIPILIQRIIDSQDSIHATLMLAAFLTLFGYAFSFLTNSLLGVILKTNLYADFFRHAFKKITKLDYSYFENRALGSITYNLDCIDVINDFYATRLINFFISVGACVVLCLYIFVTSYPIFIILIFLLSVLSFLLFLSNQYVMQLSQTEINSKEKLRELQTEYIDSVSSIKLCGLENTFFEQWLNNFNKTLSKTKKRSVSQALYSTIASVLQVMLPVTILLFGLFRVSQSVMTVGSAISLYSLSSIIVTNVVEIIYTTNQFELTKLYLDRIKDIVMQPDEANGNVLVDDIGCIRLENVSFKYNLHSPLVLHDINMRFEKGKKIAIVGSSGSGKSTIAKLLLQLYSPTSGNIFYDQVSAKMIDKTALKKIIGMIPQDGAVFNKSILDNLTLLCKDYSYEKVEHICRAMYIHEEIQAMPMKYDTIISDIGSNISGGQKQRLILARTLLSDVSVLVLDEATSSLDSVTEQAIFNSLRSLHCTQIIIAHRLSTIVDSDYIYVLNQGTVIEEGTHEELMDIKGMYYKLYQSTDKVIDF